jgi:outer membrane protein OmpA-like peptidoglycan-associated protein
MFSRPRLGRRRVSHRRLVRQKAGKGNVRIEGHTDAKGSASYNQDLSNRRAESVKKWFTSHGLKDLHFSTEGFGAKKPVAPNTKPNGSDDPKGRAKNRRVEIVITK